MSVRVTSLESGLRVVTHEMEHLESAALGVWVGAGSRSERDEEHGLSHLLEHMAFKGTRTRSAADIAEQIEEVGGEVNAATSVETTSYYARVLKDDVPLALDILSDILSNSVFDPAELAREQHVILQEIGAALDTPEDRVFDSFAEAAFPGQPIGRTILGTAETVKSAGSPMLGAYLDRHYRGPSMVVAAAGAIDHDQLVGLANDSFRAIPADLGPKPTTATYRGGESREQRDLMEAQIMLGFEGLPYASDEFYTAQILASIVGGGMSSRLFQEVREKRGLCYSIYAFHWSFADTGVFGVHAATGPEDVEELMPVVIDELSRAIDDIGDKELRRARAQLRAGLLMTLESPAARAGQLARQLLLFGRIVSAEELLERIEGISTDDLRALADRIFRGGPPTLATVGPANGVMDRDRIAERLGVRSTG
ncbi:M16 family metallopeptidase [Bauldia litoralis]|uniref:Predicted Zn-dependent peptidase n=1 Tax=Bauldia litoralis TaxID=665467 RepID=A0A1G6C6Z2_9HYPH|nr:pitrilysin family protein [Bauldia litoralis]SDB28656.1 Predicted Zn-dependent peptidase [Bauldia litoralis]